MQPSANTYSEIRLSKLFVLCGLAECILLPAIHSIVSKYAAAETADVSVFLSLLVITAGFLMYASLGASKIENVLNTHTEFWIALILFGVLLLSVGTITVHHTLHAYVNVLWFGYGSKIV